MSPLLRPTTSAQVSGHRFLVQRAQHSLIQAELRLISDPLQRRRRAAILGSCAVGLGLVAAGALALFAPSPTPYDAPVVRADSGALYVQQAGVYHPVPNLISAQLLLGEPATAARAGEEFIAAIPKGRSLGIERVPGAVLMEPDAALVLRWCTDRAATLIEVAPPGPALAPTAGFMAQTPGGEQLWWISGSGRRALPAPNTPLGQALQRVLGADRPAWQVRAELLSAIPELPALSAGDTEAILEISGHSYARRPAGLEPLTPLQADLLRLAGLPVEINADPNWQQRWQPHPGPALVIPDESWQPQPDARSICLSGSSAELQISLSAQPVEPALELSTAPPVYLRTPGAVAIDTGTGYYLLSEAGMVHPVPSETELNALGIKRAVPGMWAALAQLPAGPELSAAAAATGN